MGLRGRRGCFFLFMMAVCLLATAKNLSAQSTAVDEYKFELGGQFTLLRTSIVNQVDDLSVQCVNVPCPSQNFVLTRTRKSQPGFGGRIGYSLNSNLTIEAEINVFPKADSFREPEDFNDGYFLQGLFGAKVGKRFDKVGVFGKARPGFLHASKGDLEPRPNVGCIAIFPPPVGCFQPTSKTSFAFDVGGVVEIYPTPRTIVRFDAGDTIVRFGERNVSTIFSRIGSPTRLVLWRNPAETTHNFQVSVGIGFRF